MLSNRGDQGYWLLPWVLGGHGGQAPIVEVEEASMKLTPVP